VLGPILVLLWHYTLGVLFGKAVCNDIGRSAARMHEIYGRTCIKHGRKHEMLIGKRPVMITGVGNVVIRTARASTNAREYGKPGSFGIDAFMNSTNVQPCLRPLTTVCFDNSACI